jgi:hypothetical protein
MFGTVLQVIAAVAGTVAASASLFSVLQSRRVTRDAVLPALRAEVVCVQPQGPAGEGRLAIEIHNAGGGIAQSVWFMVALEGRYAMSDVAAFMRPGESANFGTDIKPSMKNRSVSGIVIWRDTFEKVHARSLQGRQAPLQSRDNPTPSAVDAWDRFYPDQPLSAMEQVKTYRAGGLP